MTIGKMILSVKMIVGESVGKMGFCQKIVGEMVVGEMIVGEMIVGK
jgi:hypothetical protein